MVFHSLLESTAKIEGQYYKVTFVLHQITLSEHHALSFMLAEVAQHIVVNPASPELLFPWLIHRYVFLD